MCIRLLVPIPGTTPSKPNNQAMIQITATNQRIPFIIKKFMVYMFLNIQKNARIFKNNIVWINIFTIRAQEAFR